MRRFFIHLSASLLIASALATAEQRQPNIVLILADDLGYGSLGCYGNQELKTPHIDQLAAGGMKFTDFHSNGAMCTPTRASLLTGRYQQRCVWVPDEELSPIFRKQRQENPIQRWAWGLSTEEVTLPALLQEAGYHTALIGKWHLGYDRKFHPMNYGFDTFRGFIGGNVDYHTHIAGYGTKELDWWQDREIRDEQGYSTDLLTKYACDFIGQNKTKPFFLFLAHGAPHQPWQGREPNRKQSPVENYREMITVLDESVGTVMKTLRKHQLETKTLVLFCSDNGPQAPRDFAANGPLQGNKSSLWEGGHRVPMIAHWPGMIAAATSSGEVAMTMDFLPTFTKLAGAKIPEGHTIDGTDLMPILKQEGDINSRSIHWKHGEAWAVRQGPWKLIGQGRKTIALVHVVDDPSETTNHIEQKRDLIPSMRRLHEKWEDEVGVR